MLGLVRFRMLRAGISKYCTCALASSSSLSEARRAMPTSFDPGEPGNSTRLYSPFIRLLSRPRSSCPGTCYGGAAALLELLAAAARAVIVAADLRRQARLGFRLHLGAHKFVKIGEVFDLIGLDTYNHLPAAFLSKADDLFG